METKKKHIIHSAFIRRSNRRTYNDSYSLDKIIILMNDDIILKWFLFLHIY